jgi:hypothetical protein
MIWWICWLEFWAVFFRQKAPAPEPEPVTDLRQWRVAHPNGRRWP